MKIKKFTAISIATGTCLMCCYTITGTQNEKDNLKESAIMKSNGNIYEENSSFNIDEFCDYIIDVAELTNANPNRY